MEFKKDKPCNLNQDIVLAVTMRCNSHCRMCNIWKTGNIKELRPENFAKIKRLKRVNISGGEPFLRKDLIDIVHFLKKGGNKSLSITTNGTIPGTFEIIQKIKTIYPKTHISVSIDGIGKRNDKIRGIKGGFSRSLELLKLLSNNDPKNSRISFTMGNYNIDQIIKVYNLSEELGIGFNLSATYNSIRYNVIDNKTIKVDSYKNVFEELIRRELKSYRITNLLRAYYAFGLFRYLQTGRRILSSKKHIQSIFIRSDGVVFFNISCCETAGNLMAFKDLQALLRSESAQIAIQKTATKSDPWLFSNTRTSMKRHWVLVGKWILRNKIHFKTI